MPVKARKHLPTYPSGIVEVFEDRAGSSAFSAKRNPRSLDDLESVITLHYSAESIRESDASMAHQEGVSIVLKLRTPYADGVTVRQKALIDGKLYDIVRVDPDGRRQLYIYLSGGRSIDGGKDDAGEDR